MTTTLTQAALPTGVWNADSVHSTVSFAVRHMVVSTYRGGFSDVDAQLIVSDDQQSLTGSVAAASIDSRDDSLTDHLLAEDFLDAARHPRIHFVASELRRDGEDLQVAGELTIRGHSRPITARGHLSDAVADPFGNTRLGLTLETVIDRRDFGIDWSADLPGGGLALGFDVTLTANLEFVLAS